MWLDFERYIHILQLFLSLKLKNSLQFNSNKIKYLFNHSTGLRQSTIHLPSRNLDPVWRNSSRSCKKSSFYEKLSCFNNTRTIFNQELYDRRGKSTYPRVVTSFSEQEIIKFLYKRWNISWIDCLVKSTILWRKLEALSSNGSVAAPVIKAYQTSIMSYGLNHTFFKDNIKISYTLSGECNRMGKCQTSNVINLLTSSKWKSTGRATKVSVQHNWSEINALQSSWRCATYRQEWVISDINGKKGK